MPWKATGSISLPLADRDREWDGDAAAKRVFAWAGWDEDPDTGKAAKAFFAQNTGDAEARGSYKLGFADVVDGELRAIPRGVFAVAAVLQGGRGGVDLPDAVVAAVRRKVERYYTRLDEEPPWKGSDMGMEYKTLGAEFKADGDKGEYEGHFAVFGNVDDGDDIIHQGAFTKTIAERGKRVKVFFAHDWNRPIGPPPVVLREDAVGLFAAGRLTLDSFWGREAWVLMKDGALTEGSIGYEPVPGKVEFEETPRRLIRHLRELKLYEISPVPLGMNPLTGVSAVKALERAGSPQEKLEVFAALVDSLTEADVNEENAGDWEAATREVAGRLAAFASTQTAAEPLAHSALLERQLRLKAAELALSQRLHT